MGLECNCGSRLLSAVGRHTCGGSWQQQTYSPSLRDVIKAEGSFRPALSKAVAR
jgi:hypothetical protein